jgi:anionic cell wall polymer biosynthesis LytR-Cps2A-Psr (LCP) family protein
MRKTRINRAIFLVLAIVIVVAAAGALVASYVRTDIIADIVADGGRISVLVVIELPDGRLITEVLYYDTSTNRAALFDIPANLGVVVASVNRVDSIDTVYFSDGIDTYREVVGSLVGVPVQFHIVMPAAGLETLTDLVEGVPLFVADIPNEGPEAMRIPNGDVVLDGRKIVDYVSYTQEGERDRERIARHQRAVVGIMDRVGEKADLLSGRVAGTILSGALETNLDRGAFVSLAEVLSQMESERVITRQVEGTVRNVETDGADEALLFPHQEGRWLKESVRQVVQNLTTEEALRDENIVIKLEILNGTSTTGLASRTAELFRSYGFDVVMVGNAQRQDVERTLIVDRVGNEIFANRTADIIRAGAIEREPDPELGVDVTVVLGEDFDGRYVR